MPFTKETAKLYGKKGGRNNVKKHGSDHMSAIGTIGGYKIFNERGKGYYEEISRRPRLSRRKGEDGQTTR